MTDDSSPRKGSLVKHSSYEQKMRAASQAMRDEDWDLIHSVFEALRSRYPSLQIEIGDYGWRPEDLDQVG
jgi:hypothetical protein